MSEKKFLYANLIYNHQLQIIRLVYPPFIRVIYRCRKCYKFFECEDFKWSDFMKLYVESGNLVWTESILGIEGRYEEGYKGW